MVRAQKPVHMFELTVTFDNGPEPLVTPGVLDVLAHHGVAGTFFVIGSKLAKPEARACAERAHSEGHWIGNHTWTHTHPLGEQPGEAAAQLEIGRTQAEIGPLSHHPPAVSADGRWWKSGSSVAQRCGRSDAAARRL
jgi:peptidoglycan/xylan/chitin deacetylase (PgdA/CDA1 family)